MKKTLLLLFTVVVFTNCNYTKESYMDNFRQFTKSVEEQNGEYPDTDWQLVNEQFATLAGKQYNRYKKRLTWEERQEVAQMKGVFIRWRFNKPLYLIDNEVTSFLKQHDIALD